MKLKTLKTFNEVDAAVRAPRNGRPLVEVVSIDGNITSVRIGTLHVTKADYGMKVTAEQEYDAVKRHKLVAKIKGFPDAVSYHESSYEANEAKSRFDLTTVECAVSGPIDVLIDDAGKVVAEVGDPPAPKANPLDGDDVPF